MSPTTTPHKPTGLPAAGQNPSCKNPIPIHLPPPTRVQPPFSPQNPSAHSKTPFYATPTRTNDPSTMPNPYPTLTHPTPTLPPPNPTPTTKPNPGHFRGKSGAKRGQ